MKPLVLSLALALALAACGGQRQSDTPLRVSAIGGAARTQDPSAGALGAPQRLMLAATAQGLVRFDAAGQIEPGLAERWIVIDEGRSYIFRLREAEWPDGRPVTAEQVVRVLNRATASKSENALAPFLEVIEEIVEMTPQVIEVRLKQPRPDLLKLFAQPEMAVLGRGGSGPYRATAERDEVLLTPAIDPAQEPEEGEEPEARPDRQIRLRGESAAMAIARLHQGQTDVVLGGTFAQWPIVTAARVDPAIIQFDPALGLFGFAVANRDGFLADAANRAALAMAIDRGVLVAAFHPDWAPVEMLLPDQLDSAAQPAIPSWAPLPLGARRENARARVSAWQRAHSERVTIRVALPPGPGSTLLWGEVARSLIAIGITPRRVTMGDKADIRLVDAVAPYDSARWFLVTACEACSPDTRERIDAARDARTLDERARRIAEADAALTVDSAYIPIAQPLRWSIVTSKANGWQGNTRAWHPLSHLRNETE